MPATPAIPRRALLALGATPAPLTFGAALVLAEIATSLADRPVLRDFARAYVAATGDWRRLCPPERIDALDVVLLWAQTQPDGSLTTAAVARRLAALWHAACEPVAELTPPTAPGDLVTDEPLGQNADGNGLGWELTVIEWLAAEYGWPVATILELPVATGVALFTAGRIRQGYQWKEPSYLEAARLEQDATSDIAPAAPEIAPLPAQGTADSAEPTLVVGRQQHQRPEQAQDGQQDDHH